MMPPQICLATDLVFKGNSQSERAVVLIDKVPNPLARQDIVQFATGEGLMVVFKSGHRVEFVRQSRRKFRRMGGVAYRKWARASFAHWNDFEEEYPIAAPKRARPLLRQREQWPPLIIPAGTLGFVAYQALAEGA